MKPSISPNASLRTETKLVDDIIYLEYKYDSGRQTDGSSGDKLLLIGIHYNLSYQ